jgi:hypothetical protein
MNGDMMLPSGRRHQSADISDLNGVAQPVKRFYKISSPMSPCGVTSSGVKSTNTRKVSSLTINNLNKSEAASRNHLDD